MLANTGTAKAAAELPRKLGLLDSISIVSGTMIGAGIFIVPASIARELPSATAILAVWVVAGIISFFGALAYAELGAMLPQSGGQYVYLREAYGPLTAFLCGWAAFLIIQSGSIATVAVGLGIYATYLFPDTPGLRWAPAVAIMIFTFINYRGVKAGARTQNIFTLLKVSGLALLISSAFLYRGPVALEWDSPAAVLSLRSVAIAMLGCFLAYDGWQYIAFVAGEVRNPQRNLPVALAVGTGIVIVLYLLANLAYMRVLPLSQIASTERVAAAVSEYTMGSGGAALVALTIMLSCAGAANGAILSSPRIYFAQARDGLFFQRFAEIHPRFQTPAFSILVQGIWSMLLTLTGSYETLLSYVLFAMWLFHAMAVFGVIILRRKNGNLPRPYRMWGYPVAPLLFTAFALAFVINTFISRPVPSLLGALIIASGIPTYWLWRRQARRRPLAGCA